MVKIAKICCQLDLRLDCVERSSRISEKMKKLRIGEPPMALRYVAGHGDCGAPNLRR